LTRKILCDVCGREIPSGNDVWARLTYRLVLKSKTATGRETVKKVTRTADFCSPDCFRRFRLEPEADLYAEALKYKCDICGRAYPTELGLNMHKKLSHKGR
jgi:5-methylcytosine-specific restriction endonuclease McrA